MSDADVEDALAARRGDPEAYGRLIRRHQNDISRRMWRFTRDEASHEELVQEVFVRAYRSLPGYRAAAPFSHWLHKIAVRVGFAHWKAKIAAPTALDGEARAALAKDPGADAALAAELVHRALAALPPRDRLVLTLMYLEDKSVAETAALTGWSQTMVKVQAWRARAKLRRALDGPKDKEERDERSEKL